MATDVTMTHPIYGTRTAKDRQVESYLRTGWKQSGEVTPVAVDATIADVLAQVGDDRAKALQALDAEQSRTSPRTSLVTALSRIAEQPETQES